ncbi:hypothetical protein ONJ23_26320, partial [Salmonella enterica subsp. enterica serovar Virginia]|nr:hypothetical protein [Salmonella enterica subsp. enterica serovar Virginia]
IRGCDNNVEVHFAFLDLVSQIFHTYQLSASSFSCFSVRALGKLKSFRVYINADFIGVQLGGAVKNVIAIGAGMSDGIGFGANART